MKSQTNKDKGVTSGASKSPGRTSTAAQGASRNNMSPQKTNSPVKSEPGKATGIQKPMTAMANESSRSSVQKAGNDLNMSTSTGRKSNSGAPPKPSNVSQKIIPKGKAGQKKVEQPGSLIQTRQASKSTRDLQEMTQGQKSPLKGILKKPNKDGQLDETLGGAEKRARFASAQSDDEQIRKINFQHQLEMAHKERKQGFFPNEEGKQEDVLVNTDSKTLGFSLLTNSVNQRTGEVDLNAYSLKPPPGFDHPKPINYRNLDWSFKEFMKVQEDMIAKGQIDTAIKNLEEHLNERLSIYPAKDEGVWRISQLLADVTIKTAVRHLNNNKPDESINYLKQAMKCTEPLPNSDWSENPEWVSLRKSVFKNLALYHQKKEDWNRALANFKHSLKLDQSPINPDALGAANTSLTCAVILSKLNKYAESIDYANNCMTAIEDLAGIDKSMPLTEYKQKIQKNGTKTNGGRLQEHDKMMTTYAITLHLLGNNLANLKYAKEAKMFLQRAQYVATHLTQNPRQELAHAITTDISNLLKKEGKKANEIKADRMLPSNEETSSALQSIKTNLANHAYSLAADFEEQKALLDELIQKEDDKGNEKSKYDDKALEYVKQFIEEKKKQEKTSIDEYRAKIAKDFDEKQSEFLLKQQKVKKQNALKEEMKQKKRGDFSVKKPGALSSAGESEADSSMVRKPFNRGVLARSAGIPETSVKPGDFDAQEKKQRIKKADKNLAAEGAKLDNMGLKYSADRGTKQFYVKRRMGIEKVNEKLGYFGGGILDQPKEEEVELQGGTSPRISPRFNKTGISNDDNPFENENLQHASNLSIKKGDKSQLNQNGGGGSPVKKTRKQKEIEEMEKSGIKLPPVSGYKLDSLGLGDLGETVVKKSMDMGYGSDHPFKGNGYKNPQTRKLLENIEKKDYGAMTGPKTNNNEKPGDQQFNLPKGALTEAERLEREHQRTLQNQNSGNIRDIPTYVPPKGQDSDWRDDFKKNNDSDDELPDTKQLIAKLDRNNKTNNKNNNVFEEVDEMRNDDFIKDDINEYDIEKIKQKLKEKEIERAAYEAAKNALPQLSIKPPKAKNNLNATSSDQGTTRLPNINKKRFQEDKSKSPSTSPERQDTVSPNKQKVVIGKKSPPQTSPNQKETSPKVPNPKAVSISNRKSLLPSPSVTKKGAKEQQPPPAQEQKQEGYVPPNKRLTRTQKLALEQKQKEEEEKKSKKKGVKAQEVDEGQQMKRGFDEDRLASLSTPKSLTPTPKLAEEKKKKDAGAKTGEDKAKELIEKADRGKALDLANYLDRDVPAITNQNKKKLSRGQSGETPKGDDKGKEFDTSHNNRAGLFTTLGQDAGNRSGRSSAKLSRSQSNAVGGGQLTSNQEAGADYGQADQQQRGQSEGRGLLQTLELQKNGGLTVQGLRIIERRAASTIQRFTRGYFTKKWYLNYMMRQKLGVPFSGMEFAQNVFLRHFNKPNQLLHQAAMMPPQVVEAIQSTTDLKNMSHKNVKHGRTAQGGIPGLASDKSPGGPRRLQKGVSPQQLMNDLQNQFVAKGLDAYSQFKNYGVDALTDANGNPTFNKKENEEDKPLDPNQISPRTVNVALDPYERMVPRWRGKNVERFLEVKEVGEYLDRVSHVREYEEKQREVMKTQQYKEQARQMRRHEVTTLASFAKAQGVFNQNPNKRNAKEDDEDYDPLQPGRRQDIEGGGGDPGDDDGSDQDKAPGDGDDGKKKYDPGRPVRNIAFKEEDGSIPLKMYQQFSREIIVFYKKINGVPIKWTVQAGIPFIKDRKQYMPVRVYGELQNSRHLMVSYIMNLELLRISADFYQYNTHSFETIWPFILYLFNNWVRYQVQLIQLTDNKPLFGPEEFMAPREITQDQQNDLNQLHQQNSGLLGMIHQNDYSFQITKGLKQGEVLKDTSDPLYNPNIDELLDLKVGIKQAKQDYDEALNFSSEIEYDERFDLEVYKTMVKPEDLLDRSAPKEKRIAASQIMQDNRRQLFQAYRMQLQEEKKRDPINELIGESPNKDSQKQKNNVLYQMDDQENQRLRFDEMGRPQKKVRLKLDDIYEPINIANMNPFAKFLELHFVPLPYSESGQYKLLRSQQMKGYNERQNLNVPYPMKNINLMNEERRKRNGLLPLSITDYNCIDRAALKLKLILECLYFKRQMNGLALVPRDVRQAYIDQEWQKRKMRNLRITSKLQQFSLELVKAFGEHIVYAKQYNERQIQIEQSIKKVDEYKSRKQLHSIIALTDINNKKEDKQNRLNSALQGIKNVPKVNLGTLGQTDDKVLIQGDDQSGYKGYSEQAIMISKLKEGKNLDDTSTIIINPDDLKLGLVEDTRNNKIKQAIANLNGNSIEKIPIDEMREEPPMEIHGFNDSGVEPDIQDYIHDGQIFEQGIIRIKGNLYICTLVFKKILSNFENMKSLIEERIKVHAPKSLSHQVEMQKTYKGHLRMKSKLCDYVSTHEDVVNYDQEVYRLIKPTEKIMLESEMSTKERTKYKTYLEVKINTKMSDTIWDDSFNLKWERVYDFFQIFGIKWRLHDLILKRRFGFRDRFVFFNFFGMSLSIRDTLLEYNYDSINFESFKYNNIFLKQDHLKSMRKNFGHMPFYFDDFVDPQKYNFDECQYDRAVNPYYNISKAHTKIQEKLLKNQREGTVFDPAELHPERQQLYQDVDNQEEEDDDAMIQGVHVNIYEEKKKPGLLVDEATRAYLMERRDHTNMFNLTLTNFPQSDGLFLGRVSLGNPDTYRTPLNLRIDYYSVGFIPTLQIKAYNAIYSESFEIKIGHKPTIKSFIRICNQSNQSMILNQLQSAITIGRKVLGRYIRLNFNKHHLYLTSGIGTRHGQDFMNMAICNENLIRTMLNDNYRQFSGVMYFDNLGGRNLVTVSEFEIDMYQQVKGNQSMIHMNKHLSLDQKKDQEQVDAQNSLPVSKRYQKVKLWKINVFNMSDGKTFETVISFDDLHSYYETEFLMKAQAMLKKPDLIRLLSDYLRTIYIYRSRVGKLLYWRLPMYKRPLDPKTGLAQDVPAEHMYKLKMLKIYNNLQKKIDGQNRHDDMARVTPVTMDQLKAKRSKKEPPSLSLRPKLVGEKELPIYEESQALRVLKVTSSISEIIMQRPKLYRLSPTHKPVQSLITVILHPLMECWLWQMYMPQTQRTYTTVFYPSDLFNMSPDIYGKKSKKAGGSAIWIEMVKRSELQRNNAGDIILIIDKFKEPIKEILFQDHVYNENAQDMFFMEVVMKHHNNFVTEINSGFPPMDAFSQKLNELTIIVRAFSLTRNVWIKDTMPLSDLIKILKKENYLLDNVKQLYFTMIRDAAIMLANKIIFSDEAKNTEVKKKALTYDIHDLQSSREEMERLKKQHQRDLRRKHTNKDGLTEAEQKGLKTEWRNLIDLNKIFYQSVISENPTQICTITYSDVKELFIYRLYRCSDQSFYEKRITAVEVARTCAPYYVKMMQNRMFKELGERIALYYKKDMLVASLMTYFRMQQEREQKERDEMEALEAKYKMFEPNF